MGQSLRARSAAVRLVFKPRVGSIWLRFSRNKRSELLYYRSFGLWVRSVHGDSANALARKWKDQRSERERGREMGEEREDPQRLKRIAAAAYDYDNDPRWADYWSNILVPPNLASRSDVVDHYKRKFYQRFIVILSAAGIFLPIEVLRSLGSSVCACSMIVAWESYHLV